MVVIVGIEVHPHRARSLQRRRRAHGEKVVHLPDRRRLGFGRDGVSEAPSGATEGLGEPGDGDRAPPHLGPHRHDVMLAGVSYVLVDLVGDDPDVVLHAQLGDRRHLGAREHASGGIVWRIEDDRLRPLGERLLQAVQVEGPMRPLERDEGRDRAGEDRVGTVVLVVGLQHDHFIARVDQCEEHSRHRLGRTAGDRDLAVMVDLHSVPSSVLLGDRDAEGRAAPCDRVLVDVAVNGGAGRLLHRLGHRKVGKPLREVHRFVLVRDAGHLADDRFREAVRAASGEHAVKAEGVVRS